MTAGLLTLRNSLQNKRFLDRQVLVSGYLRLVQD